MQVMLEQFQRPYRSYYINVFVSVYTEIVTSSTFEYTARNIQRGQSGIYKCVAENVDKSVEEVMTVIVTCKKKL